MHLLALTALCELQAGTSVAPAADCPWDGCYKDARSFRYEYKYSSKHVPLMKEQIWEIGFQGGQMKVYGDVSEYEFDQIQRYIPQNITSVLEVGCGLGRGSIFLNHLLKDNTIHYTLADRTGHTRNTGSFNPAEDEFYNDLALTQDFCELNGLKNITTFDTELGDWTTLPKSDFIFSLCSFGMHVSIERYMERLLSAATDNCTMIFGVRDSSYGPDSFKDLFEEVIYLPEVRCSVVFAFVFVAKASCVFRKLTQMVGHFLLHLGYQQVTLCLLFTQTPPTPTTHQISRKLVDLEKAHCVVKRAAMCAAQQSS